MHESASIPHLPLHLDHLSPMNPSAVGRKPTCSDLIRANPGLRLVWQALQMVARADTSVLLQGETGTGKEMVARAIHDESARQNRPYVKLNCAALPAGLVESELFGHERGAFTGAVNRTDGKFQQAHGGTLFLDEIGELPLELQPKLLRILQEQECERLGGGRTTRVDVRLIAATNGDLLELVRQRRFRADLYYRLNVFPILIPPLRERREDIPLLVEYFLRRLASRVNKEVTEVTQKDLEVLKCHAWPGNVRELQNVIERAMIRSSGPTLEISIEELGVATGQSVAMRQSLADAERNCILGVLRQTNGVISGPNGAAIRLGLPRTTLVSRMHRLGIVLRKAVSRDEWSGIERFSEGARVEGDGGEPAEA